MAKEVEVNVDKKDVNKADFKGKSRKRPKGKSGRKSKESRGRDVGGKQVTNDISWYSNAPQLLNDSSNINWNTLMGIPVDMNIRHPNPPSDVRPTYYGDKFSPVGLAAIRITNTFGYAHTAADPLNVAGNQIYSWMRAWNSGSTNYDAVDFMLHILGVTELYSALTYAIRLYGSYRTFVTTNKYLPSVVFRDHDWDLKELRKNATAFRGHLNELILKISSIAIPAIFDLVKRRVFMFQNVYAEGDTTKDQMYMFEPDGFYKFVLDSDGAGKLQFETIDTALPLDSTTHKRSVFDFLDYIETLADPYIRDADTATMTGDILKAFGDNIIKLSTIPEDYMIIPVQDLTVMEQIHNATIIPVDPTVVTLQQSQNKDLLESTISYSSTPIATLTSKYEGGVYLGCLYGKKLLSVNHPAPGPDINMEITRLVSYLERDYNIHTRSEGWMVKCGSEIVTAINMYVALDQADSYGNWDVRIPFLPINCNTAAGWNDPTRCLTRQAIHQFHYLPVMWEAVIDNLTSAGAFDVFELHPNVELTNWTIVDKENIGRMHRTALISLVYVKPGAHTGK